MHNTTFYSRIRADKFYSPQSGIATLYRGRLVEQLLRCDGSPPPTLVVEAQAGQGKTTLIQQFLSQVGTASAWYQVGPEDADPAFFLQAILACLNSSLPGFPPTLTAKLLEGEFVPFDLPQRLNLLLKDLDACLEEDLYLVFDDLHYLIPHEASMQVLTALLETVLPRLHFILASREPLPLVKGRTSGRNRLICRIDNHDLALNTEEVTDLFHQIFAIDIDQETCRRMTQTTDGWIMGLHLLALQINQQAEVRIGSLPEQLQQRDIHRYFAEELLETIEPALLQPLMLLSLLESIPVELAVELTGKEAIGNDLAELARRNLFVRHLDTANRNFSFNHLFQQFLQERARTDLGPEEIQTLFSQAGNFYLEHMQLVQALRYLLQAEDWARVDDLLKERGMALLATNQTATLAQLLGQIPIINRQDYSWINFYLAVARLDSAPVESLPLLDQALRIFVAREDTLGELHCLSHIISIHITTTGHYRAGEEHLRRATQIFYLIAADLDIHQTILAARSLAMGHLILHADIDQATKFASLALKLARQEQLPNFEAALLLVKGYIQIFAGRTSLAQMYLEQAAPFVSRPDIGLFNKLAIRMMLFNYLFHYGDFDNYSVQKTEFIEAVGNEMVSQSIAGPFCQVWEMDIAINRGRLDEALLLAERALAWQPPLSPHLRSLILQLKAQVLALQGQRTAALEAASASTSLREISGGAYFVTLNKIIRGLIHAQCRDPQRALSCLREGIEHARQMPTEYLEACGLLHRALVYIGQGDEPAAIEDVVSGLRLMRQNSYRHFWGWTPAAMMKTLSFAVVQQVEPVYARSLAAERLDMALLDDGTAIPLLEIRTLGHFKILHQGHSLLQAEDLTPTQRELLCLLLASPGFKLPQEAVQLHFWPDSPPNTARVKFDTLVSRLRKTLALILPKNTVLSYLKREKGMLWLAHCRADAPDFLAAVSQGIRHLRLQENWQAGNAFTAAAALWQGEFAPGVSGEDRIRIFRLELSRALTSLALSWSTLLADARQLPEAVLLVEKALRNDPLCERLHGQLYRLQGQGSAVQARRVLQGFAARLQSEGYSASEITELLDGITADPA